MTHYKGKSAPRAVAEYKVPGYMYANVDYDEIKKLMYHKMYRAISMDFISNLDRTSASYSNIHVSLR